MKPCHFHPFSQACSESHQHLPKFGKCQKFSFEDPTLIRMFFSCHHLMNREIVRTPIAKNACATHFSARGIRLKSSADPKNFFHQSNTTLSGCCSAQQMPAASYRTLSGCEALIFTQCSTLRRLGLVCNKGCAWYHVPVYEL